MFGLGFGELLVLLLVAMIVLGPRELPRYLRKAGQFAGKMRRLANEMREKSGIDEVLRVEGLDRDLAELRKLTRGELTGLTYAVREATTFDSLLNNRKVATAPTMVATQADPSLLLNAPDPFAPPPVFVDRLHEYPSIGPDSYDAMPDTATVYEGGLPRSPLADDPLYAHGVGEPLAARGDSHGVGELLAPPDASAPLDAARGDAPLGAEEDARRQDAPIDARGDRPPGAPTNPASTDVATAHAAEPAPEPRHDTGESTAPPPPSPDASPSSASSASSAEVSDEAWT